MCPRSIGQRQRDPAERISDARIHQRLLDSDPIAPAELAETYLPRVIERLKRKFRRVPEHDVMQAAADAILTYAELPGSFDPTRLSLESYLAMSAQGDLLNALAKRRRLKVGPVRCPACGEGQLVKLPAVCPVCGVAVPRGIEAVQPREVSFEAVAEAEVARNTGRDPSPAEIVEQAEGRRRGGTLMEKALETIMDPQDRQLVRLMLGGERKTAAYSAILGVQGLEVTEQRRLVKQHKDRLTQRLRRLRGKLRE